MENNIEAVEWKSEESSNDNCNTLLLQLDSLTDSQLIDLQRQLNTTIWDRLKDCYSSKLSDALAEQPTLIRNIIYFNTTCLKEYRGVGCQWAYLLNSDQVKQVANRDYILYNIAKALGTDYLLSIEDPTDKYFIHFTKSACIEDIKNLGLLYTDDLNNSFGKGIYFYCINKDSITLLDKLKGPAIIFKLSDYYLKCIVDVADGVSDGSSGEYPQYCYYPNKIPPTNIVNILDGALDGKLQPDIK